MARAVVKENGLAPAGEGVVACMHTHIYIYTTNTNPIRARWNNEGGEGIAERRTENGRRLVATVAAVGDRLLVCRKSGRGE